MKGEKSVLRYFLLGIFMIVLGSATAQTTHYLFFQTETNKPFYLRIMGSTLSSNATGYLLIPKLTNGKYEIHIGFAQSDTEQQFDITVEGRDLGFSLKQELDNSWSLFNLVDFSQYKGKTIAAMPKPVLQTTEAPSVQDVKEEDKPVAKKEPVVKDSMEKQPKVKEGSVKKIPLPPVVKIYDRVSVDGHDLVFVVNGPAKSDTVIIYVPAMKPPGMAAAKVKSPEVNVNKAGQIIFHPVYGAISNPYKHP